MTTAKATRERHKSAYLINESCMCCTPRTCVFHFGITCCTPRRCFWHFDITCCTPARAYFILVSRAASPARAFVIFACLHKFLIRSCQSNFYIVSRLEHSTLRTNKKKHLFMLKIIRTSYFRWCPRCSSTRELKQPRRRRQQTPHKFAYLTMKNRIFARFARASFIFWHFEDVLVHSTSWNDLFCSCVDDVSIWWQMFNFVFSCPKRWFQFNSRMVRTHFSSIMTSNNWKMIAETRSYIFRWRSRFRRRWICSLLSSNDDDGS